MCCLLSDIVENENNYIENMDYSLSHIFEYTDNG